jgi:hypothetical protein
MIIRIFGVISKLNTTKYLSVMAGEYLRRKWVLRCGLRVSGCGKRGVSFGGGRGKRTELRAERIGKGSNGGIIGHRSESHKLKAESLMKS